MAEPDKRQIGDGSDNYGEAAKQMAKAAKEAGKETAKQAAVKGAEAGANAAAATVQAGVEGGKAVAADPTMVQWAHDAEQADRMVTRLATDHEGTVVLLKGSHASGLSALAERWTQN